MPAGRPGDEHIWDAPALEGEGEGSGALQVIDVEPGVGASGGPAGPGLVVTAVVQAVEAPALPDLCAGALLAEGQQAHREAASRVGCEDDVAERGRWHAGPVHPVRAQSGQHGAEVAVQPVLPEEAAGLRSRPECRGDQDDVPATLANALAQRPVGELSPIPVAVDGKAGAPPLVAVQVEDDVHSGARAVAGGHEDPGHGPARALRPQWDLDVQGRPWRVGLPLEQSRCRARSRGAGRRAGRGGGAGGRGRAGGQERRLGAGPRHPVLHQPPAALQGPDGRPRAGPGHPVHGQPRPLQPVEPLLDPAHVRRAPPVHLPQGAAIMGDARAVLIRPPPASPFAPDRRAI